MKNFFKGIGNFFKKIGLFIWKYLKICWNFIKDNAWIQPIAIVALIFVVVFGFQGIVEGIENIKQNSETKEKEAKNKYTKLTMGQVKEKLEKKQDFVLFVGSHNCIHCENFKPIINKYIGSTGKTIYYIDIEDTSDTTMEPKELLAWKEMLTEIDTREIESLNTPTVIVIRGGEFKDAKAGAQALNGGMEYLNFVKFVEGEYIGKIEPTTSTASEA